MSTGSEQGTAIEPLRFEDGALMLLDQRALPEAERWIRCETVEDVADCIRTLAVRGAPAIGLAAAYGMALADGREDEAAELLRSTRPDGGEPRRGRSSSAAALRTCWRWLVGCTGSRTRPTAGWQGSGPSSSRAAPAPSRTATPARSPPAATGPRTGCCARPGSSGRLAEVWVDETRPLLQGARLTAWELRQAGIPHRVVADSAAGSLMARGLVDRVVVGADRIAANGDVANKVGTYPLAVLAGRHDVPFYVAAPAIDDRSGHPGRRRDPDRGARPERGAPRSATRSTPAFDVTPAELVTAIVTEAGVLEAPYRESIARAVRPHDRRRRAPVPLAGARWSWGSAGAATWWARSPPPRRAGSMARSPWWAASAGSAGRSIRSRDRAPSPRSRARGGWRRGSGGVGRHARA